ncbi:Salivary acidic proline-rich phosphoprotein 1/2 [Elasticomyces elasticus]|uniref:RNA helicase n=1 Tax=Exophiala sideris TaxID=1016849 RepID=A0ABR0JJQ1_9EURO|nr:Salivary acidic proline-rich phosphoprotein 1/2 [Elasticomyces elasticus]KAK5030298.1 Salivary acidic proline-rich phosphoprotein 1/2 [Exophiala sideris]KAK5035047.1 Salivary acidic proline-rich phosphoprotein 1/2 [Exophiala sideris]KAK5065970.1 Salivary acidic proline-rich phosphoprotein 1/2 [Exophiala sideris]KAK5178363.1 Salivary acidic proline-rich phosphoprotein 1/2 [Eurotiomycetes sp. CCFEE 6388]
MSKDTGLKAVRGSTQMQQTTKPPKGIKRSAAEAFTANPRSVGLKLNAHRRDTGHGPSEGKTVVFHESGENKHEITASLQRKPKPNLKERARDLLLVRQQLPIYKHADQVKQEVREHDVLLLVGETGSGKSTQIPQFLVTESWCKRKTIKGGATVGGCIAITQPRRVAAISLARRVAEEMGTPLGNSSPASQVGFSVRFENSTSPSTKIKFLTEGMLLQEMLRDPWLKEYSAVVVDEVHERGVNVDLVLGFLRRMQDLRSKEDARGGIGMKVVIMSATADMERIRDFFNTTLTGSPAIQNEEGVEEESSRLSDDADKPTRHNTSDAASRNPENSALDKKTPEGVQLKSGPRATSLFIKGRQHPVTINYAPAPVPDVLDAAYQRIMHIHSHTPLPGDILVFLTGQETVESLLSLVTSWSASIQKDATLSKTLPKLLILPLYAALPSTIQQRVFQSTPRFTRKIILATNIAETSITVPGIRYVIDTGKAKQRLFRPSLNLDTLLTVPISRSSANQRSGRAGRDAPGTAYRLYTESDFFQLSQDTEPEILRCDLSQLVLTLKAHGIDDLQAFPFLTRPPRRALERAMIHLLQLSALDPSTGQITTLGRDMSVLPLPASLARVLLASADPQFSCTDEIIDIVSALSVENIFLNIHQTHKTPESSQDPLALKPKSKPEGLGDSDNEHDSRASQQAQARRQLYRREGDHLTLLATMQAYAAEPTDRRRWCDDHAISHRAMTGALDVRKQLISIMQRRQRPKSGSKSTKHNIDHDNDPTTLSQRLLKCILTGFHPNVARLSSDGSYRTLLTNQAVAIHPSSVLFSAPTGNETAPRKFEAIMYNEFVYTGTKAYARGVSAVEMGWVSEVLRR